MKNILFITSLFLLLLSCSKSDDENIPDENTIIGSWKLIEIYGWDGINDIVWESDSLNGEAADGQERWYNVDNGYTYTFKGNGDFVTNRVSCIGDYTISDESFVQINGCDDSNLNRLLYYYFDNNFLILAPEPNCIDGCIAKFTKINEQQ